MNKLAIIIVLNLLLVAFAEPLPSSGPSLDDIMKEMDEKAAASEEASSGDSDVASPQPVVRRKEFGLFDDYCAESSIILKTFLRDKINGASATIYSVLFASFNELSNAVLEQQAEAANEGVKMIENSSSDNPVVADRWTLYYSVKNAARHVYNTVIETASSQALVKLAQLRELYSIDTLITSINSVCDSISYDLIRRLNNSLAHQKRFIKKATSKKPDADEVLGILTRARIETIGCKLTTRISYTSKFCDILKIAGTNIYNAIYSNPELIEFDK